uniref:Uncharacterized protein n=1 Tax=viral metagenome TaxID=1070528 RepID=A0A6C0D7S5_9ZZZZ
MLGISYIIYGLGTHIFLNNCFPEQYNSLLINTSFYLILTYSYFELNFKRFCNNKYILYFSTKIYNIINKNNTNEIDFVKDSVVIESCNKTNLCEKKSVNYDYDYDFIIFSDYDNISESSDKINKVIYYKDNESNSDLDYKYKICKFSFISITIQFIYKNEERLHTIKLSNDYENYYIVGNKINRTFISYLMKHNFNINLEEANYKYKITFIDNNVNIKNITENEEIIFNENDYEIAEFSI